MVTILNRRVRKWPNADTVPVVGSHVPQDGNTGRICICRCEVVSVYKMSCLFPLVGYRGKKNENGKRPIVFNRSQADYSGYAGKVEVDVPCGKCEGCRADKALSWAVRCANEASLHQQNCFITITYDDYHLPKDGKISKDQLRTFLNEIRSHKKEIRYYACGEYGSKTNRPHYHACIFGTDFKGGHEYAIDDQLYGITEIDKLWGQGKVSIAGFTMATACYVAGYVGKKAGKNEEESFQIMSTRPGIGFNWLRKYWPDVVATNSVVLEGREYPVPPQYIRWCEENMDNELLSVKIDRTKRFADMTPEQIWDQHRVRRAKEVHFKQKIQRQKEKESI